MENRFSPMHPSGAADRQFPGRYTRGPDAYRQCVEDCAFAIVKCMKDGETDTTPSIDEMAAALEAIDDQLIDLFFPHWSEDDQDAEYVPNWRLGMEQRRTTCLAAIRKAMGAE